MLPKINPLDTAAWQALGQHADEMHRMHMRELFSSDPDRFRHYSLCIDPIVFDYSKNIITNRTMELLFKLAEECRLKDAMQAMFNGEIINETEKRAVLHTALRNFSGSPVYAEGQDIMPDVKKV